LLVVFNLATSASKSARVELLITAPFTSLPTPAGVGSSS
jgi:hypothetical protein